MADLAAPIVSATSSDAPRDEGKETVAEKAAPIVAEFMGTFMLVFTVGVCCIAGNPLWNATAIAAMLMVMIYGFGPISGGHFNPAVSMACGIAGKTPWVKVFLYILTQIVAGIAAGLVCWGTFGEATPIGPKHGYNWFHVGVVELFYTAILCFVHLNCATSVRNNPQDDQNHFFGLAIGFVIVAGGYAAGDISGACFNPAVTLGLDVSGAGGTDRGGSVWRLSYIVFEQLGGVLAALLFHACRFREGAAAAGRPQIGRNLQVRILAAHGLQNKDTGLMGDVSDPYVTARMGNMKHRTPTINNNLDPVWTYDNIFFFPVGSINESSMLVLEAFNDNVFKDSSLGSVVVDPRELGFDRWQQRREPLEGGRGELEFELRLNSAGIDTEPRLVPRVFSEFLGTFTLCLTVGLNVVTKSPATAWSAAAALMSMIYSLGNVCGGHFNPAVTLGVVLSGRSVCPPSRGLFYVLAQLLAGVLAGLLHSDFHVKGPYSGEVFGLAPGVSHGWWAVFFAELVFTFMLVFVVLAVATTSPSVALTRQNFQFALAIGSCVTAGGVAVAAVSGGALNPAVAWGLATASAAGRLPSTPSWSNCIWFSFFELFGGVLAAALFFGTHRHEYKKSGREAELGL